MGDNEQTEMEEPTEENELLKLAKECLGIVESSTMKNKELKMLIGSAKEDLKRVDIDVEAHIEEDLIKTTIMLYVKAQYGDTDINKRKEYLKRYKMNLGELQHSEEYRKKKEVDSNA